MDNRLPPREGEWIDRSQPVEFRFEGRTYNGFAGDVLSSALWANGVRLLGRSFKYHRPRGVYSLMGHDVNVMVENGQRFNLRGDVLPIESGADLHAVNTFGGLERDRLRIMDRFSKFLPVGFYYKAFHTPRKLFPIYENQMRKVAGLGKINPAYRSSSPSPKDYAFCDLLVVGAGPAGLSGAIAAAEHGLEVLLVDEQPHPGGSFTWQLTDDSDAQQQFQKLLERAHSLDNLQIRSKTQVAGCYDDHWVALVDDTRLTKLRAKSILVASGCIEQPAVFQNNDLPGVMLGSAAQRLIRLFAVKPCERAVVLVANCDGYRTALDLHAAGVEVAAVVDLRSETEATELERRVADAGISIHHHHAIYEAVPLSNKKGLQAAVVCPLDDCGNPLVGSSTQIPCDGIVMSVGWAPNAAPYFQAGGRFHYAEHVEQLVPKESPASLFAAGRLNGVFAWEDQLTDGRRAGLEAARFLERFDGEIPTAPVHQSLPPSHPYPIFSHKGKKNFVDLDEDIHLVDFANAHQEGYDNIELMKRFTTVGMGPSQGKLSNMNAVRILARLNNASINETGTTTSRPFYQPVPLGHLAGRQFHPQRRTPMDHWHEQANAQMMHGGAWMRPEYYQIAGKTREECIFDEAVNVRQNAGLIDVGTLGKLEISGPDAVEFLERIYTGRFAKQKIGRLRYGLACDESGVIIEDGVVARLDENRFYVTATSSGTAAFHRDMQRWALIWNMDVTLVNSTGQLAAMNLTGPKSRDILEQLTDIDLQPESFPYLGVQHANISGVPALLMRVGFVGELGYEVHVPASYGLHVWTSLMQAGEQFSIQPFGVEAQRLLRLEKGHLIVGQDTDALTNPYEADVAWAIGKNKPFFVGARSLEIAARQEKTRQLVGLVFPRDYSGPLPEECHLIIENGEMAGRITSIAQKSTLGYPVALAFVRPDMAKPGRKVEIQVDNGSLVQA